MAVNDVLRVRVVMNTTDQIGVNVLHYIVTAEVTGGATLGEIAAYLDGMYHNAYKTLLTDQANYRGVGVQRVRPLPTSQEAVSTGNEGSGTQGGDPLPKQIAGLLSWKTIFAGPGFRGRTYVPFPPEQQNDPDGTPSANYLVNLATLSVQIRAGGLVVGGGGSSTLAFGIYKRQQQAFNGVVDQIIRPMWATQRRRGDFGRKNVLPF